MEYDLVVVGRAFIGDKIVKCAIWSSNGIITKISSVSKVTKLTENKLILKDELLVLPGMIDIHVHLRDLKLSYKEDFYTGTCAAAAGGVTIVCDMPNTIPFTNTYRSLLEKLNAARKSIVDYCIYFGYPKKIVELEKSLKKIIGVKIYPEDYDKPNFTETLNYIVKNKILLIAHTEIKKYIKSLREIFRKDLNNIAIHNMIRNKLIEYNCILKLIKIFNDIKENNINFHFTHITSKESVAAIKELKKIYKKVTLDTCPHYIFLSNKMLRKLKGLAKVNPPLRSEGDRLYLLKALSEGVIDAIVSDHAPHTIEEKIREKYDEIPSGFPGLETTLPLLFTLANKGMLSIKDIVKLYSKNPAKIIGVYSAYGSIEVGKYCNLTIVNLKEKYKIDPRKFYSKAKFSPFEGMEVVGKVKATIVRGKIVFDSEEITAKEGHGKNVVNLVKLLKNE